MARERDGWLGDFSLVLSREHFRSTRRDQQYEVFSGSKPLALLWLVVVAAARGNARDQPRSSRASRESSHGIGANRRIGGA